MYYVLDIPGPSSADPQTCAAISLNIPSTSSSPSTSILSDIVIPQIQLVDEQVKLTRNSHLELANHIENLNETLISVLALNGDHPELDAYLES